MITSCNHDLHGPDDCGVYCISRDEAGGMSYGAGDEEYDDNEGNVVLPRTNDPVDSVVHTSGPDEPVNGDTPCWTGDEMMVF